MNAKTTRAAFTFLCHRNPFEDVEQSTWVFMLMDFQETKGDKAIEALAGFYCWAIDNLQGDEKTRAIRSTFAHDVGGRNDKFLEPRSADYAEFWDKEIEAHPGYLSYNS